MHCIMYLPEVGISGLLSCAARWHCHKALPRVPAGPGAVVGVIPEALKPRELSGETIGELHTTQNMHQRKVGLPEVAGGLPSCLSCLNLPDLCAGTHE